MIAMDKTFMSIIVLATAFLFHQQTGQFMC